MKDILEASKCEGCGVYPSQTHKDGCPWLVKVQIEQGAKRKLREMIEEFIDIDGLVDRIYERGK
jgi:hypothetical protein